MAVMREGRSHTRSLRHCSSTLSPATDAAFAEALGLWAWLRGITLVVIAAGIAYGRAAGARGTAVEAELETSWSTARERTFVVSPFIGAVSPVAMRDALGAVEDAGAVVGLALVCSSRLLDSLTAKWEPWWWSVPETPTCLNAGLPSVRFGPAT